MDRSTIHEKIAEITELININNNRLFLHDEKIAQIEIDLLRKNAIELYEQINLLHITNLKSKSEVKITDAQHDLIALKEDAGLDHQEVESAAQEIEFIVERPAEAKTIITEEIPLPIAELPEIEDTIEEIIEPPSIEPEEIFTEPENTSPDETLIPSITEPEGPVNNTPEVEVKKSEENSIKEKPSTLPTDLQPELFEIKTVTDNSSKSKSDKSGTDIKHIFEKYRTSKIDSIKKAISILKKYEFQNQLFGNDPKTYNQSIEMLDQATSAEVAISLLENSWPGQYNWGEKEEKLVEELKELVYRRFS